ncbi:CRISPR-associated protein, Csm3 family [Fervidobacterium changbaicum]|uniref:CRISPR system Cms endoribonuclease Csm3 n=1 Tax=Fervidobacterium changbaicum TaxID=310769 RepID=A0ABX5QRY9_9BACT|nr:type III-A CRISPR-associated RAMP protein Csm3 [Fervidobacterium changbaicum]QAV33189.1 type III-A CRISPR-associated RAMP protein Csm3 [Fervidobacterium changbaicum]SDH70605.1 CRISPR-associated protein, Csm3 family [Fervidobacterium changbaicum]
MGVKKFLGKYIVKADIEVITGLHIGTNKDSLEIGGLDNPVIKDPKGRPYIPGSSLKGKMRVLSEFYHGKVHEKGDVHKCADENCPVCGLFGTSVDNKSNISTFSRTRLIVRDAYLDEKSLEPYADFLETKYTEVKHENSINRVTSRANPRPQERVPAGAIFKAEFVVDEYEGDEKKFLMELFLAMKLLEDDYLGGSGSRGYGKIAFRNIQIVKREKTFYSEGKDESPVSTFGNVEEALSKLK